MRFKEQFRSSLSLKRFFLTYTLVFLIPTVLMIALVQASFLDTLRQSGLNSLDSQLDSLRYSLDKHFLQMEQIGGAVALDRDYDLNYLPRYPVQVNELKDKLKSYVVTGLFFNGLVFYNVGDDYLYSDSTSLNFDTFITVNLIDGYTPEELRARLENAREPECLIAGEKEGASLFIYPMVSRGGKKKVLIFSVPNGRLESVFETALASNCGAVRVTSGERVIASFCNDDALDEELMKALIERGDGEQLVGGRRYFVKNEFSSDTGLNYAMIIGAGEISRGISRIGTMWSLIIVIAIASGIFAAAIMSRISYEPIKTLDEKASIASAGLDSESEDVYRHISESIEYLSNRAEMLQSSMSDISDYLAFRLFKGEVRDVEEVNQLSRILGVPFGASAFQAAEIRFTDEGMRDPAFTMREILPRGCGFLLRHMDDRSVYEAAIFYTAHPAESFEKVKRSVEQQSRAITEVFFGEIQGSYQRMPLSYAAAKLTGCGAKKLTNEKQEEVISELAEAMGSQTPEKLENALTAAAEYVCGCDLFEARMCAVRVFQLLNEALTQNGKTSELPDVYMILDSDAGALGEVLSRCAKKYPEILFRSTEPDAMPLIDRLKEYIENNYLNIGFSLQQTAYDFHINPSWMSKYFKNECGMTISEYITGVKITAAKKLLRESGLSVKEIGMELGYYGQNSFIRRFKSVTGMTPGEYRNLED